MTKQQLLTGDFNHYGVVKSLGHSVREQIETQAIKVQAIKITCIDPINGINAIVLVTDEDKRPSDTSERNPYYTLWKIHYFFYKLENWDTKVIQNAAKFGFAEELPDFKAYINNKKEKCTPEEASQKCFRKFISEIRTFEQKRLVRTY